MDKWKNDSTKKLFKAFTMLKDEEEVAIFCRDLMTEAELGELAGRFAVAEQLYNGNTQRKTSEITGVSIATVTRVNHWLRRGMNGYRTVLDRLKA
jgi:TrpR-related protein YerC/YecD